MSKPKCRWCGKKATVQLARGGWYCDKCYAEGVEMEEEAMGLYDKNYIRSLNAINAEKKNDE